MKTTFASGRRRPKKILAVDWDSRTLRVVHAFVGKREMKIDRLLSVALPDGVDAADPDQMGDHIRQVLEQEGITTRSAIVDIPRDQAILNRLTLPTRLPEELPGMVEIQIAKELPFAVAEAVIDFAAEPFDTEATTADVLVAAIQREVLERYEKTFTVAGLKLQGIGLRPYAHKVAVCDRLKHAIPDRVMFIDVRPIFTEIDVIVKSSLVFSRAASVVIPLNLGATPQLSIVPESSPDGDGPDAPDAPEAGESDENVTAQTVIQSLVVEVTRSIEAYRTSDPGANIDHVVIGGDLGVEEMLADAINSRLGITTEIYNPASSFGWAPDEGTGASAFAATLGLVLGLPDETGLNFDFLHPKKTVSQTKERLKKAPLVATIAALFIAAGGVAVAKFTKPERDRLAGIEARILELQANVRDNRKFVDLVDEIRAFDAEQYIWVDELYDAMSPLPSMRELVVDHIGMSHTEPQLTLKTRTRDRDIAGEVIRALEAFEREGHDLPRFKVSMGPQGEKAKDYYRFTQELRITILDDEPARPGSSKGRGNR